MISPFGKVIMECRKMLSDSNIALFFIRRSANMAVHFIARESCSFSGRIFNRGLSLSIFVPFCWLIYWSNTNILSSKKKREFFISKKKKSVLLK